MNQFRWLMQKHVDAEACRCRSMSMQKHVDAEACRCRSMSMQFLEKLFAAGCASRGIGDMIIGMAGLVIG
jgi:hypothetical protein